MIIHRRYVIRVLKSILYITLIFLVCFGFIYFLSEKKSPDLTFIDFFPRWKPMVMFFVAFGMAYPLVGFSTKEVGLIQPLRDQISTIKDGMDRMGYELSSQKNGMYIFKLKKFSSRMSRLFFEDIIEMSENEGILTIEGIRKDMIRVVGFIESINKRDQ